MPDRPETSFRHRYRQRVNTSERKGAMGQQRLTRTVVLAALTLMAVLVYAVREMGVDAEQLRQFALLSLVFVVVTMGGGIVVGGVVALIRRWRR